MTSYRVDMLGSVTLDVYVSVLMLVYVIHLALPTRADLYPVFDLLTEPNHSDVNLSDVFYLKCCAARSVRSEEESKCGL